MTRLATLLTAASVAAYFGLPLPAEAQTPQSGKVPMHPDQLTLKRHGHTTPRTRTHNHVHHTFNQRTPIHGTFVGPRI